MPAGQTQGLGYEWETSPSYDQTDKYIFII